MMNAFDPDLALRESPAPREVSPGVWWLGGCLQVQFNGLPVHNGQWAYLVEGSDACLLVEGGLPIQLPSIEGQLAELLRTRPPLRYVWATHQEIPHAGGVGRVLANYPDAVLCGDVRDYHLIFPELIDRLVPMPVGAVIDLGDTEFVLVEAVIRDLPTTQWAFDSRRRILFTGDGFAFSHIHTDGQCRMIVEEAPDLPIEDLTGVFAELALEWMTVARLEPYLERLEELFAELHPAIVLPSHGLPIGAVAKTVPRVLEGLRLAGRTVGGERATTV